jgi:hypothetical protein
MLNKFSGDPLYGTVPGTKTNPDLLLALTFPKGLTRQHEHDRSFTKTGGLFRFLRSGLDSLD